MGTGLLKGDKALQPLLNKGCSQLAQESRKCLPGKVFSHLSPVNRPVPMNANEHLKAYLEKSFFAGQSSRNLQEIKAQLPIRMQDSLDSKEEIVKKLWEGLQVIDKSHIVNRIAWAAHLDIHF